VPAKTSKKGPIVGKERERLQVPYPTVVSFKRVIKLLAKNPEGFGVTRSFLLQNRVPTNAVYPVLYALRFFGLTDDNQATQPQLVRFLNDKEGRTEIIHQAYEPLLERLELPATNRKQLIELLRPELRSADSILPLAATFFIWAMSYAGEPVVRRGAAHRPGPRPGLMRPEIRLRGERNVEPVGTRRRGPMICFEIHVDKDTTKEDIERMINTVHDAHMRRR
jgi:hypothetical protein